MFELTDTYLQYYYIPERVLLLFDSFMQLSFIQDLNFGVKCCIGY